MKRFEIDTFELMKFFYDAVDGISDAVFLDDRPQAENTTRSSYVVVTLPVSVLNKGFYFQTAIRFECYTKLTKSGYTDMKNANALYKALIEKFPIQNDKYLAYNPTYIPRGNDETGYNVFYIQADLRINNTDKY